MPTVCASSTPKGAHGVYPCAGTDEWCVISLRSDDDRNRLAALIGSEQLPTAPGALTAAIRRWTAEQDNHTVAEQCQRAGIPAAPMLRAADVLTDPQVAHRSVFTDMAHPLFDAPMPTETRPVLYRRIPSAPLGPAPTPGEHTREVCHKVLGLDLAEIDRLIRAGVLHTTEPTAVPTTRP